MNYYNIVLFIAGFVFTPALYIFCTFCTLKNSIIIIIISSSSSNSSSSFNVNMNSNPSYYVTVNIIIFQVLNYAKAYFLHYIFLYCNVLGVLYSRWNFIALQKSIHYS
jgi:hypothetical protein